MAGSFGLLAGGVHELETRCYNYFLSTDRVLRGDITAVPRRCRRPVIRATPRCRG